MNLALGNTYATTRTIAAAYQMIQRHTPAALRLVLDADDDVYTVPRHAAPRRSSSTSKSSEPADMMPTDTPTTTW